MFVRGQCWEIEGFSAHMVKLLQSGQLVFYLPGHVRALNAKRLDAAKVKALRIMQRSVVLIRESIQAEFPHFDAVMAFDVFDLGVADGLTSAARGRPGDLAAGKRHSLERLAKLFDFSFAELKHEFETLHSVAMARKKTSGCENREAWQWAWRRVSAQRLRRPQEYTFPCLEVVPQTNQIFFVMSSKAGSHLSQLCMTTSLK